MAFKMKYSPIKGVFGDFFKNIGAKKTDMGKLREKQARSSKGVSEYQHRVEESKRKRKAKRADVKSDYEFFKKHREAGTTPGTPINPPKPKPESESKGYVPQEFKGEAGDKFRYRRVGDHKPSEIRDYKEGTTYAKFEFMDPDRPGKWIPAKPYIPGGSGGGYGPRNKINQLYKKAMEENRLFDSPVEKKSPYKKGIGKYAKKAKGSRGYKMKRK
jgi:hypothetical protein